MVRLYWSHFSDGSCFAFRLPDGTARRSRPPERTIYDVLSRTLGVKKERRFSHAGGDASEDRWVLFMHAVGVVGCRG